MTQVETSLYCVNHPNTETMLRCSRCERPICTKCAVLTPTGYRCRDCVRGQQKVFETAQWIDYPLAVVLAAGLGYLGSLIASTLGFFTIFIAPIAGVVIAEAVRAVTRRRRSKRLFQVATLAAVVGSLPLVIIRLLFVFAALSGDGGGGAMFALLPILWSGLYTFLMATTLYYRLSGIRIA